MTFANLLELFGALWFIFVSALGTLEVLDIALSKRLIPALRGVLGSIKGLALRRIKETQ